MEKVLDWFQTTAGQAYLKKQISKDTRRLLESQDFLLYPVTVTEQLYRRIQKSTQLI